METPQPDPSATDQVIQGIDPVVGADVITVAQPGESQQELEGSPDDDVSQQAVNEAVVPVDEAVDAAPTTASIIDAEISPEEVQKQDYVEKALANLRATSRTATGVIDTSASSTKADAMVEGLDSASIAETAVTNFASTIAELYDMKDVSFESPADVRSFLESVAKQINGGLLKEGQLIRSGADSDKYPYTRIADLDAALDDFSTELFARLQNPDDDPIATAAWVEYRVDLTDHFFADGCGKTAKALSAFVLMRSGQELPTYRDRKELYSHAPKTIRGADPVINAAEEQAWLDYYKTLF